MDVKTQVGGCGLPDPAAEGLLTARGAGRAGGRRSGGQQFWGLPVSPRETQSHGAPLHNQVVLEPISLGQEVHLGEEQRDNGLQKVGLLEEAPGA